MTRQTKIWISLLAGMMLAIGAGCVIGCSKDDKSKSNDELKAKHSKYDSDLKSTKVAIENFERDTESKRISKPATPEERQKIYTLYLNQHTSLSSEVQKLFAEFNGNNGKWEAIGIMAEYPPFLSNLIESELFFLR